MNASATHAIARALQRRDPLPHEFPSWCGGDCSKHTENYECHMMRDLLPRTSEGAFIESVVRSRIAGEIPNLVTTDL